MILTILTLMAFTPIRSADGLELIEKAAEKSRSDGKPVLVDFHTSWCVPCQHFLSDYKKASFKNALNERVHLVKVDSDADNELAEHYKCTDLPTWLLLNGDKEILARFRGYKGRHFLLKRLDRALAESLPIPQRESRHQTSPNFNDALILAQFYDTGKDPLRAIEFYIDAESLRDSDYPSFISRITEIKVWLLEKEPGSMNFDELVLDVKEILSSPSTGHSRGYVLASRLIELSRDQKDRENLIFMLGEAVRFGEMYEGNTYVQRSVKRFRAELLKLRDHNDGAAAALYKETLKENWGTDKTELIAYVSWCAQIGVEPEKTDQLTKHALTLDLDSFQRADVLAARAILAWRSGEKLEASSLMEQAIANNPNRPEWHKAMLLYRPK